MDTQQSTPETQHTTGPWPGPYAVRRKDAGSVHPNPRFVITTAGGVYSELAEMSFTSSEAEPTARLFASAPTLAEDNARLRAALEEALPLLEDAESLDPGVALQDAIKAAKDALKPST